MGLRCGKTPSQQRGSATGTTVAPGHATGAPVSSSVGLDTMEWCDGTGRKRREEEEDG